MISVVIFAVFSTLSQIVAIGAQSTFLLYSSQNKNKFLAPIVCSICDTILICIGVLLCSEVASLNHNFITIIKIFGSTFLLYYAYLAIKRGFKQNNTIQHNLSNKNIVLFAISVSILNPNALIDAIVVLGSLSLEYENHLRLIFTISACITCFVWNIFLTIIGSKIFNANNKHFIKYLDFSIGILMIYLAIKLIY